MSTSPLYSPLPHTLVPALTAPYHRFVLFVAPDVEPDMTRQSRLGID